MHYHCGLRLLASAAGRYIGSTWQQWALSHSCAAARSLWSRAARLPQAPRRGERPRRRRPRSTAAGVAGRLGAAKAPAGFLTGCLRHRHLLVSTLRPTTCFTRARAWGEARQGQSFGAPSAQALCLVPRPSALPTLFCISESNKFFDQLRRWQKHTGSDTAVWCLISGGLCTGAARWVRQTGTRTRSRSSHCASASPHLPAQRRPAAFRRHRVASTAHSRYQAMCLFVSLLLQGDQQYFSQAMKNKVCIAS